MSEPYGNSSTGTQTYSDAPKVRQPQVLAACDGLEKAQAETRELIAKLEERLNGVLRGHGPEAGELKAQDGAAEVPLASMISGAAERQWRINAHLRGITDRLEL